MKEVHSLHWSTVTRPHIHLKTSGDGVSAGIPKVGKCAAGTPDEVPLIPEPMTKGENQFLHSFLYTYSPQNKYRNTEMKNYHVQKGKFFKNIQKWPNSYVFSVWINSYMLLKKKKIKTWEKKNHLYLLTHLEFCRWPLWQVAHSPLMGADPCLKEEIAIT